MKLEEAFQGDKHNRGRLWSIEPNGKKNGSLEKLPFDWPKHFKGEENIQNIQGLSPVDLDTGTVRWLGLDVDLKIEPKEFCGKVFSLLGGQYFCFRTTGKKWRVVEFFDEPIDVDVAKVRAKDLETRMEKVVGYECDRGHTLPQSYNLEEKKPGGWWYMPYCTKDTVCYSPGGRPLSKSQTEYRLKYKHSPLIVASVGMVNPGRHKSLFAVALANKHLNLNCDLKELNNNFDEPLLDKLDKDIQHTEKQSDNYNKEYLLNGTPKWCEEICGVKPKIDAKGLSEITTTLSEDYIYVRARKDFYEYSSCQFIDREQMNDYWKHIEKKGMSNELLKEPGFSKVKNYLTHPGYTPGLISLEENEVKGLDGGDYLNVYKESTVEAKKGDVSDLNKFYTIIFGENNWHIIKQCLAFMLRAKEETKHNGIKIQWFVIIHSPTQGAGKGLLAQLCQTLFGHRNVKIDVKFKHITNTHSTIVEGAQLIFINELVLRNNTGDQKELSEEFKSLITEPNLIINPKNKPQIEIPNLCNFFVLSNSEKPLYISEEDRRAFVVNIRHTKEEVKELLENQGYKNIILNHIKDPSAFKWHLLNEIEYDREMFFEDAPITADKEEMIRANWSELEKLMRLAYEEKSFPFAPQTTPNSTYTYRGIVNANTTLSMMKEDKKFSGTYCKIDPLTEILGKLCTPWPNGEKTKQMELSGGQRLRVYLFEEDWTYRPKGEDEDIPLSRLSPLQLGQLWQIEPGKDTQYGLTRTVKPYTENVYPTTSTYEKDYRARCWSCSQDIELNEGTVCDRCDFAIKCPNCGKCACDRPDSKIRRKKNTLDL